MAKKKSKSSSPKGEMLLVQSKAKAYVAGKKSKDKKTFRVAGDAFDGLNAVVHWYLDQAVARAEANGLSTVRAHDFIAM